MNRKRLARTLSIIIWDYLYRTGNDKKQLKKDKPWVKFYPCSCPLCDYFTCTYCILGHCMHGSDYDNWYQAVDNMRKVYAEKILDKLIRWKI